MGGFRNSIMKRCIILFTFFGVILVEFLFQLFKNIFYLCQVHGCRSHGSQLGGSCLKNLSHVIDL